MREREVDSCEEERRKRILSVRERIPSVRERERWRIRFREREM